MTEVNVVTGGQAPAASDQQPQAIPGNPGNPTVLDPPNENDSAAAAAEKQQMQERRDPATREGREAEGQLPMGKVVRASDVNIQEEKVDIAGVRIDPITGIAVSQIEHGARDATPTGPAHLRTWPLTAFDSRKLKGHETVTVNGSNVVVADDQAEDYDRSAVENDELPESTRNEVEAGRKALSDSTAARRAAGQDDPST